MSLKYRRAREWLSKHVQKPKRDYPLGTVAHYGPTKTVASKLVAAVFYYADDQEPVIERWFADDGDVREAPDVTEQVVSFLKSYEVQRVLITHELLGCPHEEGIDYPIDENCPRCPAWADPDRMTGELTVETSMEQAMNDLDDFPITYSPHCQVVTHEGVSLDVRIYIGVEKRWLLEVVNENGTSISWSDLFDSDDQALAEFQRTLEDEGLAAFEDE